VSPFGRVHTGAVKLVMPEQFISRRLGKEHFRQEKQEENKWISHDGMFYANLMQNPQYHKVLFPF
jgi:ferredoxin-fold anticodon binding domain-containing protein